MQMFAIVERQDRTALRMLYDVLRL